MGEGRVSGGIQDKLVISLKHLENKRILINKTSIPMSVINLPDNLGMSGFSEGKISKEEIIDIGQLTEIKDFILSEITPRVTINYKHSSYGLKHKCQNYIGKYVSNGQFIASMILLGHKYKQDKINAFFYIKTLNY